MSTSLPKFTHSRNKFQCIDNLPSRLQTSVRTDEGLMSSAKYLHGRVSREGSSGPTQRQRETKRENNEQPSVSPCRHPPLPDSRHVGKNGLYIPRVVTLRRPGRDVRETNRFRLTITKEPLGTEGRYFGRQPSNTGTLKDSGGRDWRTVTSLSREKRTGVYSVLRGLLVLITLHTYIFV